MSEKIMGEYSINDEQVNQTNCEGVNYAGTTENAKNQLPTKVGFWTKFKNFWLQEINVELTPKQQKVEDEINEFLHQEITWQGVKDFLFQDVTFGKKNKNANV